MSLMSYLKNFIIFVIFKFETRIGYVFIILQLQNNKYEETHPWNLCLYDSLTYFVSYIATKVYVNRIMESVLNKLWFIYAISNKLIIIIVIKVYKRYRKYTHRKFEICKTCHLELILLGDILLKPK